MDELELGTTYISVFDKLIWRTIGPNRGGGEYRNIPPHLDFRPPSYMYMYKPSVAPESISRSLNFKNPPPPLQEQCASDDRFFFLPNTKILYETSWVLTVTELKI